MDGPEMVITPWAASLCTSISSFCHSHLLLLLLPLRATALGFYFRAQPILVTQQGVPLVLFTNLTSKPPTHNFLFLLHQWRCAQQPLDLGLVLTRPRWGHGLNELGLKLHELGEQGDADQQTSSTSRQVHSPNLSPLLEPNLALT